MTKRRVVVTGLGTVNPLGNDVETTWQNVLQGKSGITNIDTFDASELTTRFMGDVKDFDPTVAMTPKEVKRYDTFIHFGCAAAKEAVEDSKLEITDELSHRVGVIVSSGIGGLPWIEKNYHAMEKGGPRRISPFFIPGGIINSASGLIAIQHKCRGPNYGIVSACTTGTHSLGVAARTIAYGDADVMITGGCEASNDKLGVGGFAAARALSTRNDAPEKASRPFDKDRDGFVMGEGAAVLILEEYEHAKARGAKIYAELTGFGTSDDASHITLPDENAEGAYRSMQNALKDAGLEPNQVQYINAHGTSTKANDKTESKGISRLFGADSDVAISSTKSMTGHLLGAAGAIEAIFSVLALRDQVAPPTINLDNVDPECGSFNFVPKVKQEMTINNVLSNSFGFGGTNGSLIFSKVS